MANNHLKMLFRDAAKLTKQGKLKEAIEHYEHILHHDSLNSRALFALGNVAKRLGSFELAETMFRATLDIEPTSIEAANNLGVLLHELGRDDEAVEIYKHTLTLEPESVETWVNLGVAVAADGDMENAEKFYTEALRLKPTSIAALANMAEVKATLGEFEQSNQFLEKAIKRDKSNSQLHHNRGQNLLTMGKLDEGWAENDYRLKPNHPKAIKYEHKLKRWHGEDLSGKKILVSAEQGIGDQILFSSCLADLISKAEHVVVEVEPRLVSLFARSFPKAEIKPYELQAEGGVKTFKYGWDVKGLDYAIPQMSIYRYLRADIADFANDGASLLVDTDLATLWAKRVASAATGLKIGLCWSGRRNNKARIKQYSSLDQWGKILSQKGVSFFNLMYENCADEISEAEAEFKTKIITFDDLDYKDDIEGVAALTAEMDVVISAPSAPAIIAAGVGVETIVLYSGVGWLNLGTDHVPFNSNITALTNASSGDWTGTIDKAAAIVAERAKV